MSDMYFKSLPDKSTPLIPDNLNKLNDIKVSPTKPTTNEKVWIKTGKNLSYINNFDAVNTELKKYIVKVKVQGNTDYTISGVKSRIEGVPIGNMGFQGVGGVEAFDKSGNLIENLFKDNACYVETGSTGIGLTITTPINCDYIIIDFSNNNGDSNLNTAVSNIQIEQGSTATAYEEYVEKAIYVKNDNGVYEPFYKESEMNKQNYSTEEQVIGTWIDEKPLYRKVVVFNDLLNSGDNLIPHGIQNLDKIIRCDLFTATRYLFPNSYNSNCYGSVYMVDITNVKIHLINDNYGVGEKYIVIEYTKTTD